MARQIRRKSASRETPRPPEANKDEKGPNGAEKSNAGTDADDTDSFDFGGLPIRDLKKNLGCG